MSGYAGEFLRLTAVHCVALVAPGPDFAVVLRQSLARGRRAGLFAAAGIASGLTLHVTYSLFGVGLLIKKAPAIFTVIKWAGVCYLGWLGLQSLRAGFAAKAGPAPRTDNGRDPAAGPGDASCYRVGLLTNALNPKVTLFFVAIFVTLISPLTPTPVRILYGVWICLVTCAWFMLVATLFTQEPVRRRFVLLGPWIDRAMGVVFILFAALLAAANLRSGS